MKKISLFLVFSIMAGFMSLMAQQRSAPAPSPLAKFEQQVGLTDITITYSRPSVKDRAIYGGLVPYDKLWRTGANMATKIQFSKDVKIEGRALKAGEYSLFSIPGKNEWTLIFNTVTNQSGTGKYDESKDALRVKVKSSQMQGDMKIESFTIDINHLRDNSANLELLWDKTYVAAKIEVDVN